MLTCCSTFCCFDSYLHCNQNLFSLFVITFSTVYDDCSIRISHSSWLDPTKHFPAYNNYPPINNFYKVLISGADVAINVTDLRAHTHYSGGYDDNHDCIKVFWKVVGTMSDEQRRLLLKFVTSCSRPPLLGFKVSNCYTE